MLCCHDLWFSHFTARGEVHEETHGWKRSHKNLIKSTRDEWGNLINPPFPAFILNAMRIYHFSSDAARDIERVESESRRKSCFYGFDGYEDLCSTNKKIYLSMDTTYIFLIFLINLGLKILYWKCKHPNGIKRKSFKQQSWALCEKKNMENVLLPN